MVNMALVTPTWLAYSGCRVHGHLEMVSALRAYCRYLSRGSSCALVRPGQICLIGFRKVYMAASRRRGGVYQRSMVMVRIYGRDVGE
ncbi:hypothetical protein BDV59DRAFT_37869 [Aspergillus ambiguus]|uniref:uncharacterized protein n=1 Tax=Aspergillus ambiguus TaxID=176160 RepID=UPI003CCD4209